MESKDILNNIKGKSKSINSNNKLKELKSDFFLQLLFNIIPRPKSLESVKYNKYLQKRIRINFNDYKAYSEMYSSIEIEIIIPMKNKYDKIINIKEGDSKYYHKFFNDVKKEEIKRMNLNINNKFSKINIIIDHQVNTLSGLFRFIDFIQTINFKRFSRNNITDTSYMFDGCSSLKELNLTNFNTDNVTYMHNMFYDCSSLKKLNLTNFNTNNVTNMHAMFCRCSSLKELNLSNFNTNNVTDMSNMFDGCLSLRELNLTNFNTNNVINMNNMFFECSDELKSKIKTKYKNFKEEAFY